MKILALPIAALALLLAAPAAGQPLLEPDSEVGYARNPTHGGKRFLCFGTGLRKKWMFKVYAIGFCAEEAPFRAEFAKWLESKGQPLAGLKGAALAAALRQDERFYEFLHTVPVGKSLEMVFLRDVSGEKMRGTFTETLVNILGANEKPRVDAFVAKLTRDLKRGDNMLVRSAPGGEIHITLGGEVQQVVDPKLEIAIWWAYLGSRGIETGLRESVAQGVAGLR